MKKNLTKNWDKLISKMIKSLAKYGIPKDGIEYIKTPFGILMVRKYTLLERSK